MNLLEAVAAANPGLPPSQARVGALVLANPRKFVRLPVGELARQADVSTPTVVRFCRSLGMGGLSEFKLALAGGLGNADDTGAEPFIHPQVSRGDSPGKIISKLMQSNARTLLDFANAANANSFKSATRMLLATIKAGGKIEFYGLGNSGIVAQDGQHKFFRLGANTVAYADAHLQIMAASLLSKADTVVTISAGGNSRELLEAAKIARAQGASVIAISASQSPLAGLCKILLAADHTESRNQFSPMESRLLHLSIIDILATCTALGLGEDVRGKQRRIKRNLRRVKSED